MSAVEASTFAAVPYTNELPYALICIGKRNGNGDAQGINRSMLESPFTRAFACRYALLCLCQPFADAGYASSCMPATHSKSNTAVGPTVGNGRSGKDVRRIPVCFGRIGLSCRSAHEASDHSRQTLGKLREADTPNWKPEPLHKAIDG